MAAVACGGGTTDAGTDGTDMGGTVTITVPQTILVVTGRSSKAMINMTRQGRTDAMTLSVEGLPQGVTVAFDPPVLAGGTLSSTATFTAAVDATTGPAGIVFKATPTSNDGAFYPALATLIVARPQITIARGGTGSGTVTSSPAGIDCGSACSSAFTSGTSITLTATPAANSAFAGWAGGQCSGTSATCAFTVSVGATITATFNSTAESFSVSAPATASVPQGGTSSATVGITRINGYAGAVTFTAAGAPSGLTITAPSNVTGNAATLGIAAASSVPAGSYPVTVSATGAGIGAAQLASLTVQVTPAAGGAGIVTLSFASCDPSGVPIWFATQSGTGAWTQVAQGSNGTFTFPVAAATGIAWVTRDGTGYATNVIYGSESDITTIALGSQCTGLNPAFGTTSLTGKITGVGSFAKISIGGASTDYQVGKTDSYTLDGVPSGRRDLVATSYVVNGSGFPFVQKLILRRNVSYTSTIPQLNFGSTEAVVPPMVQVTRNNLGNDQPSIEVSLITANGASQRYYTAPGGPNVSAYFGIPDALLQAGDLHLIANYAASTDGASVRLAGAARHTAAPDAVTFGPPLNQPTVSPLASSPYVRMRVQLASQSEYAGVAEAKYLQNANVVSVAVTRGYSGASPTTWTVDVPDLTAAGYDAAWGLTSGTIGWQVTAAGGDVLPLLGAAPFDGARLTAASVNGPSSAQVQRWRFHRWF